MTDEKPFSKDIIDLRDFDELSDIEARSNCADVMFFLINNFGDRFSRSELEEMTRLAKQFSTRS